MYSLHSDDQWPSYYFPLDYNNVFVFRCCFYIFHFIFGSQQKDFYVPTCAFLVFILLDIYQIYLLSSYILTPFSTISDSVNALSLNSVVSWSFNFFPPNWLILTAILSVSPVTMGCVPSLAQASKFHPFLWTVNCFLDHSVSSKIPALLASFF